MSLRTLRWINIVALLFLIIGSTFFSSDELYSTKNAPLLMPAGYAFSIWGLIYFLLGIWVILPFTKYCSAPQLYERIGLVFAINQVLTALTVMVPERASLAFIVGSLLTLILIYVIINREKNRGRFFRIPFSFFLGWISVATIVDAFIVIKSFGITTILGIDEYGWSLLLLIIIGALGIFITYTYTDIIYSAVFIWALIAITVRQTTYPLIDYICYGIILLLVLNIISIIWRKKS